MDDVVVNTLGHRYRLLGKPVMTTVCNTVYRAVNLDNERTGFICHARIDGVSVYGPMVPVMQTRTRSMAIQIAMDLAVKCAFNRWVGRKSLSNAR